jgi:hypothetical protein
MILVLRSCPHDWLSLIIVEVSRKSAGLSPQNEYWITACMVATLKS